MDVDPLMKSLTLIYAFYHSYTLAILFLFRNIMYVHVFFVFCLFFSVQLLSVLRGHSVLLSPPQRPMTSDFERISIPDLIRYIIFLS